MRWKRLSAQDVEAIVAEPQYSDLDEHGNPRFKGHDPWQRTFVVVVAKDDRDFVITVVDKARS